MATLFGNFLYGTITNNPLTNSGTTLNSANLASMQAVASPDIMWIVLDPAAVNGAPEIVKVTAHTASATSATITRGQQGTTARQHASGTQWVVSWTADDAGVVNGTDLCGRVYNNGGKSVATSTAATIPFDAENYDYSGMHSNTVNNDRVTIATAGVYHFTANVVWNTQSQTGYRYHRLLRYNSSNTLVALFAEFTWDAGDNSASNWSASVSGSDLCSAGDYITVEVWQNSGSTLSLTAGFGLYSSLAWHCIRVT